MKKIKIDVSTETNKNCKFKYYLYFNNQKISFSSKRKAEDFIRDLNNITRDNLLSLNDVNLKIQSLYYNYYCEMPLTECNRLNNNLHEYNNRLTYLFKDYGLGYSSMILNNFTKLILIINQSITLFLKWAKKINDYTLVNLLNSRLKIINMIENSFTDLIQNQNTSKEYKTIKLQTVHSNLMQRTV